MPSRLVWDGRGKGSEAVSSPVAIVWPCPLTAGAYVAAGRGVEFPRLECPSCARRMGLWSGYWRYVRAAGRGREMFGPRGRCGGWRGSPALPPPFVLGWPLGKAPAVGAGRLARHCRHQEAGGMDHKEQEQLALRRWGVIAEAAGEQLTAGERGALARQIAARDHPHPDGSRRRYSRGTIDRWLRAWRKGGLEALKPSPRADTGVDRAHPELFAEASALRLELPGRSAAQIASLLYHRHGVAVADRTVRGQLRRAGLHRAALAAAPKAYGRYEAARPNERWITDVLAGPWVPWPKREVSARARLFLMLADHSRLLV